MVLLREFPPYTYPHEPLPSQTTFHHLTTHSGEEKANKGAGIALALLPEIQQQLDTHVSCVSMFSRVLPPKVQRVLASCMMRTSHMYVVMSVCADIIEV